MAKTEYEYKKTQPWVNTARNLTFLDETQELISIYDRESDVDNTFTAPLQWTNTNQSTPPSAPESHSQPSDSPADPRPFLERISSTGHSSFNGLSSPTKRRRLTFSNSLTGSPTAASPVQQHQSPTNSWHASPHTGWTPASYDSGPHHSALDPAFAGLDHTISHTSHAAFKSVSESLSRIYLETPVWPLPEKEEARLLRHFVEKLAQNFDLTDPLAHFKMVVPQRAATCPTLLNAIFALSARHLSRIGDYDPLISNRYHQECLKHLIPMLDDTTAILDENLLASTIILRHLEEIEVPLSGQHPAEQQSHLLGAHAFMAAQERATITGGLRQAAFWVGLRQEIYVAFVNQRSIIPALEHCNIDRSLEAADDHVWSCRMVALCADIIRYCFGEGDRSTSTYTWLADNVDQWYLTKPAAFTPVYHKDADHENVFPEIWFVGDEVCIGWQHYYISKILLSAHNPRVPRLGPSRAAALRVMDDEIKEAVKQLCGIAMSNLKTPPNFT